MTYFEYYLTLKTLSLKKSYILNTRIGWNVEDGYLHLSSYNYDTPFNGPALLKALRKTLDVLFVRVSGDEWPHWEFI